MSSLDENAVPANFSWLQSVQTLIIGRLIVVFLLLVTTWVWYSGRPPYHHVSGSDRDTLDGRKRAA